MQCFFFSVENKSVEYSKYSRQHRLLRYILVSLEEVDDLLMRHCFSVARTDPYWERQDGFEVTNQVRRFPANLLIIWDFSSLLMGDFIWEFLTNLRNRSLDDMLLVMFTDPWSFNHYPMNRLYMLA